MFCGYIQRVARSIYAPWIHWNDYRLLPPIMHALKVPSERAYQHSEVDVASRPSRGKCSSKAGSDKSLD